LGRLRRHEKESVTTVKKIQILPQVEKATLACYIFGSKTSTEVPLFLIGDISWC